MDVQTALDAINELVIAAEAAGWDQEAPEILNNARDAYASLLIIQADAGEVKS